MAAPPLSQTAPLIDDDVPLRTPVVDSDTNRENPITRNLELTLPDKRGVGNQISWNNARFFEYTGTNAFSRIQKVPILQDRFRAKTRLFPTYQDLAVRYSPDIRNLRVRRN